METVFLRTFDKVAIAADYYAAAKPIAAVIYVHMMPATKESWRDLAEYLAKNGVSGIAVDLRGHGQSALGPDGYKTFKSAEHQESTLDLRAAVDFLHSLGHGFKNEKIVFIGASIGANLSLQFIATHQTYNAAFLLSAGLDYHGINAEVLARNLSLGKKVFFVACHDDMVGGSDNAAQNEKLFNEVPSGVIKAKKIYETGGHGTRIFDADKDLFDVILKFITMSVV